MIDILYKFEHTILGYRCNAEETYWVSLYLWDKELYLSFQDITMTILLIPSFF